MIQYVAYVGRIMFRLVYWEDLREHLVQSEAVVFPIKYRGETHLLGA